MKWIAVGPCVHCGADDSLACPVHGGKHERFTIEGDESGSGDPLHFPSDNGSDPEALVLTTVGAADNTQEKQVADTHV